MLLSQNQRKASSWMLVALCLLVGFLITMRGCTTSGELLSTSSDQKVLLGVLLGFSLLIGWGVTIYGLCRKFRKDFLMKTNKGKTKT